MKIKLESPDGKVYEAFQKNPNVFAVIINGDEYLISLSKTNDNEQTSSSFTEEQKKDLTKAIFKNDEIFKQLESSANDSEEDDIDNVHDLMKMVREVQNREYK